MTCRRPYVFPPRRTDICVSLRRAIHFARKEDQAGFFAFDYGAGDNDTPVARHTRPGGRPRVVISKTLGEPASGCKRSTRLPCSHVRGGRAANTAQKTKAEDENDTVVDVESVRRREQGSAPHQFAANGGEDQENAVWNKENPMKRHML